MESNIAAAASSSIAAGSMPISDPAAEAAACAASSPCRTYRRYLSRHNGSASTVNVRISRVIPRAISERGSARLRASLSAWCSRVRSPVAATAASHAPCTTAAPAGSVSPSANETCALRPSSSETSASTAPSVTVQSAGTGLPASRRSRSPTASASAGRSSCPSPCSTTAGISGVFSASMLRRKASSAPMPSAALSTTSGKKDR